MMRSQGLLEAREGNLRGPTAETGVPFNAPNGETTSSQTQTLNVADWNVHRRRERPGASARIIRATLGPPKITNHIWCDGAKRLFRSVQGRNQSPYSSSSSWCCAGALRPELPCWRTAVQEWFPCPPDRK